MLQSSIAHSIICVRLFRGKMHSDWLNGIEILQGRLQHGEKVGYCYPSWLEKTLCKWDVYVPLVTKGLIWEKYVSGEIICLSNIHDKLHGTEAFYFVSLYRWPGKCCCCLTPRFIMLIFYKSSPVNPIVSYLELFCFCRISCNIFLLCVCRSVPSDTLKSLGFASPCIIILSSESSSCPKHVELYLNDK